jgi:hypothetical protein
MMKWKDGTTSDQVAAVEAGLGTLPALIDQIRRYEFGPDLAMSEANFDFVLVADSDSVADFQTYSSDPDHLAVIESAIKPIVSEVVRVQYEL